MKAKKHIKIRIGLIVVVFLVLILFFGVQMYLGRAEHAASPDDTSLIPITVSPGTGTSGIAQLLQSQGLISDVTLFKVKSRLEGYDGKYRTGEYLLSASMTMEEIMGELLKGRDNTVRFTIPEGYDIRRTVAALESVGLIEASVFREEIKAGQFDYWFLMDSPKGENRLEGYLYPDTYEIFAGATEHEIIQKMLDQFGKVFTEKDMERAKELGMNINEILTLASIIEREAVIPEDRPVISGVFYNRMDKGMALQSCATVQYILGEQKPVLSIADTQIESPYNTYLYNGLPPAPICSPGKDSIQAALWPEESEYLYFLAKGDGSHVFSRTYDEHLRNKEKYID